MESDRKATVFSAFAFGLIAICFVLLLQEVVLTRKLWSEIPRVFAGFLVPVPIAVYVGFLFAHRDGPAAKEPSPLAMTLVLSLTLGIVILVGHLLSSGESEDALGMGPVITQAAVFSTSILNLLFLRNQLVAAVLGGVSVGLTIVVIFFS